METNKLKAVEEVFPKQKKGRIAAKGRDKKWSVRFIETLLKEAREQDEAEKGEDVIRGESFVRPGWDTLELSEPDDGALACEKYEDIIGAGAPCRKLEIQRAVSDLKRHYARLL